MAEQELKTLVAQGLQALRAGGEVAKKATAEIQSDASDPELKAALQTGNDTSEQWAQRVEAALREAGGAEQTGNPILEAHYKVSQEIRAKAPNANARDLGIVAAGQLALHYWIASFGTLANYADRSGMAETERTMRASLDEAKQADLQHTAIAEKMLARGG